MCKGFYKENLAMTIKKDEQNKHNQIQVRIIKSQEVLKLVPKYLNKYKGAFERLKNA